MEAKNLGRSGLLVSPLCLGTMNFGPQTSEEDAFAIMEKALEVGVFFFDTADVYGGSVGRGTTESIVGRWMAQGGGRREAIVLATKVFGPMDEALTIPEPNKGGRNLSKYKIIAHCEASLRRLQTDRIDLYQMHHIDRNCPHEEYWEAFETLQAQGKVVYVGSSNFAGWDLAESCMTARARGNLGLVSEQSIYNLANRYLELEVLPACERFGIGVIPWSPLNRGILAGKPEGKVGRRAAGNEVERFKQHEDELRQWGELCRELGHAPAQVALAWLLTRPAVAAPIIGPRTMEQLTDAIAAVEIELDAETLRKIDVIWPGFESAPQHYAW